MSSEKTKEDEIVVRRRIRSGKSRSSSGKSRKSRSSSGKSKKSRSSSGKSRKLLASRSGTGSSSKIPHEEENINKAVTIPPRKMGHLMVFYTVEKETPIGKITKEVARISMIKIWSEKLLIQRENKIILIERFEDIKKEGPLRFTIKYSSSEVLSFQAHTQEEQAEWLKILFRVWDDKKTEKRRLAQQAEREKRILEGRLELTVADDPIIHAAQDNDLRVLRKLRRSCENLDVCSHGAQSRTALHVAVMRGHMEAVSNIDCLHPISLSLLTFYIIAFRLRHFSYQAMNNTTVQHQNCVLQSGSQITTNLPIFENAYIESSLVFVGKESRNSYPRSQTYPIG